MQIKENYPLKDLNTFGIEAIARFFVEVASEEEAVEALSFSNEKHLPVFILGGGSNILISDEGFEGLVIHNKITGLKIEDSGLVTVGAGESWDDVAKAAVEKYMAGIECLSGIPGSAGGAVVQNIGAYGQTLSDVVEEVYAISLTDPLTKLTFSASECQFAYRTSRFKNRKTDPESYIITRLSLKLKPDGAPTLTYADLKNKFPGEIQPGLSEVRQAIIEIRASKGMVIMPGFETYKSVGSFFVNPVVSEESFENIQKIIGVSEDRPWSWPQDNGTTKVSAAKLISMSGYEKGYREGNVGISPKQPLAIISLGEAKANEIRSFAAKIKQAVLEKFGVQLEEEVLYIGSFNK